MYPEDAGAGGNWPRIDEQADPSVIRQECDECCGAACGQMLLQDIGISVEQQKIVDRFGKPLSVRGLAEAINYYHPANPPHWKGGYLDIDPREAIEILTRTGSWVAVLWEKGARIGHMVIVDGIDGQGLLLIRDPLQGTSYKMRFSDFINYWTEYEVSRLK